MISMTTIAREARYVHHRELKTSKTLVIGGSAVRSAEEVTRRMGYSSGWSDSIECSATWKDDGTTLVVQTLTTLETSQGTHRVTTTSEYTLSTDLMSLTVREWRSTRTPRRPRHDLRLSAGVVVRHSLMSSTEKAFEAQTQTVAPQRPWCFPPGYGDRSSRSSCRSPGKCSYLSTIIVRIALNVPAVIRQ